MCFVPCCVLLRLQPSTTCSEINSIYAWKVCHEFEDDKQGGRWGEKMRHRQSYNMHRFQGCSPDIPERANDGGRMSLEWGRWTLAIFMAQSCINTG